LKQNKYLNYLKNSHKSRRERPKIFRKWHTQGKSQAKRSQYLKKNNEVFILTNNHGNGNISLSLERQKMLKFHSIKYEKDLEN
jgi:hypothetical protein